MATMRVTAAPELASMMVAQISKPGADFELIKREIPNPGPGQVRIKVQACGICHSDVFTKEGLWPGIQYPRVPGHEVVGIVDEVGAGGFRVEEGAARARRLAWRPRQYGSRMAGRRFSQLPELENSRHQLRLGIPAIHSGF